MKLLLLGLAACGRIGFTDHVATDDAAGKRCVATQVAGFDWGASPLRVLSAAITSTGFSIGGVASPSGILRGVHLDAALVPNAPTPFQTTPATGSNIEYLEVDLAWDGTNLVGTMRDTVGELFLKLLAEDMTGFFNADFRAGHVALPSFARGANANLLWFDDVNVKAQALGADGKPAGAEALLGTTGAIDGMSAAANGRIAALVSSAGSCTLFAYDDSSGATENLGTVSPCSAPQLVGLDSELWAITQRADKLELRTTSLAPGAGFGAATAIGTGSAPIAVRVGSNVGLAWLDGELHIGGLTLDGRLIEIPISGAPAAVPDVWDVVGGERGPMVFAAYGSQLWTIDCR